MKYTLIIEFFLNYSFEWTLFNKNEERVRSSQENAVLDNKILKECTIIVLVPGVDVQLTEVKLPKLPYKKLVKALAFALEERVMDNMGSLHIALGNHQKNNMLPVAIVSKIKMDKWSNILEHFLKSFRSNIKIMLPNILSLPISPFAWTISLEHTFALVRMGHYSGFAIEKESLWPMLHLFLNSPNKPRSLECGSNIIIPDDEMKLFNLANITISHHDYDRSILRRVVENNHTINLLQREYKSKINYNILQKNIFFLIVILFVVLTVGECIQILFLASHHQQNSKNIIAYFSNFYPDIKLDGPMSVNYFIR